jgi:hypothetical protein
VLATPRISIRHVVALLVAIAVISLKVAASASASGVVWIHLCGSWTPGAGLTGSRNGVARSGSTSPGVAAEYQCPSGENVNGLEVIGRGSGVAKGSRGYWEVDAPTGFAIIGAVTEGGGMTSYGVNQNWGWGGGFYWKNGGSSVKPGQTRFNAGLINSPYFGWQIVCGWATCDGATKPGEITVLGLELAAIETTGPSLRISNQSLGSSSGWVRGSWPIAFSADGPSGACRMNATLGSVQVSQTVTQPINQTIWHQCPAGSFSQMFDTASVPSGPGVPLTMWAGDASYDYQAHKSPTAIVTKAVNIDNAPVSLTLSGPTDSPSTAGPQTITATAQAGPSGVRGTWCSVDNAPYQLYPGATAQIRITGIGAHAATCFAENNALDVSGRPARSAVQTWRMTIREPSVSTVSFARVVNALRCIKQRERVRVPARWVTVTYHGHKQRIRIPAETRTVTVVHCHARIVRRRVKVNGHWRVKRVVLLPHTVRVSTKTVRHGARSSVAGWLGTDRGNAIGGQPVAIQTAPDTGSGRFTTVVVTTTASDGSWSATVPAGPSRLVRAVYLGTSALEPSVSTTANVVVPASVSLGISPRHTHWGGTIALRGRLRGGYIPPAGELVVLWVGWPGGSTEIGHLYARPNGRFASTYTFLRGNGTETYRLWATTARESDYPYAPARSRSTTVKVSP